jgi:hypothetical protein
MTVNQSCSPHSHWMVRVTVGPIVVPRVFEISVAVSEAASSVPKEPSSALNEAGLFRLKDTDVHSW